MLSAPHPDRGEKATCPRCGYVVYVPRVNSIERTFAFSLAGLLLFPPAVFLPMLGIRILGDYVDAPLWLSTVALFEAGMWLVGGLVLICSLLFPLLVLLLSCAISGSLLMGWSLRSFPWMMRYLHQLREWSMLEVYCLGIIVACVKLGDVAELYFGQGLFCFVGLLVLVTLTSLSIDERVFWQRRKRILQPQGATHAQ